MLDILVLVSLALIMSISLKIVNLKIKNLENLLLNSYSLLINFFMFGQAGPGLRALYLKNKYKLEIKKFIFLTLIYYAFYALISTFLVILGSQIPWYISVILLLGVFFVSRTIIKYFYDKKINQNFREYLNFKMLAYLFIATLFQLIVQTTIYGVELNMVSRVTWHQILAYSGFANLSLFVSVTPAGIGIREYFLILSESIHHISSHVIVASSIIDRSVYLIFLLLILVFVVIFHASDKIKHTLNSKK